jgi:hypothetical protein
MKRTTSAPADQPGPRQDNEDRAATRRALLTRGGVVAAGVVGAGVAGAAVAGRANAMPGDPVLQGTVNTVGTNVAATEIDAANDPSTPTPTVILTNTGGNATTGEGSPTLRLTPAAANLFPPGATAGGDMMATNDGVLWFTHDFPPSGTFLGLVVAGVVQTDVISNSFVPLAAPTRILDTRSSGGRAHVSDPSGKFDSTGRLLAGKIIHINLSSLVIFADAVTANLTVINPAASGYLTLWSGVGGKPTAASIAFSKGQTISNLAVSALAHPNNTTDTDSIAIFASATTHVILDVAGFTVADFGQVLVASFAGTETRARAARIKAARAAIAKRPT